MLRCVWISSRGVVGNQESVDKVYCRIAVKIPCKKSNPEVNSSIESTKFYDSAPRESDMRMSWFSLIPVLLGILLLFSPGVSAVDIIVQSKKGQNLILYKDYYALVIGVSNYQKWPKIPFAVRDAKEVAERLELLGFKTKLVLDPTHREMLTALNEMVYVLGKDKDRALLLYYAGHGETETLADKTKMGYVIPKDCPPLKDDPMGFVTHAVSMREIETISLRIKSKHVLMLFDSCFSGSLFTLVRSIPHDITEKSTLPVRQYITAGSEDEEVPDRSVFKRCFLIGLEGDADLTGDGYITGSELGMYLADNVVNYTNRAQHPQYGKINNPDLDRGDFIFVPPKRRQIAVSGDKGVEGSSAAVEELERLREEKKRHEETVAELKKMLQERQQGGKSPEDRIAAIPKESTEAKLKRITLRSTPDSNYYETDLYKTIKEHNFYSKSYNPSGDFINDFVDNGNGTITDIVTGLVWQKEGSQTEITFGTAQEYVRDLNEKRFAGYTNWRLPTIDELCSLLEPGPNKRGQHIDELFAGKGFACWSSDQKPQYNLMYAYVVYFGRADVDLAVSSGITAGWRFVRAVRTMK